MFYGTFHSDLFFLFCSRAELKILCAHSSKNVAADKQNEHNANAEN